MREYVRTRCLVRTHVQTHVQRPPAETLLADLPRRFSASKTSMTVTVMRLECSAMTHTSCTTSCRKDCNATRASEGTSPDILFTPGQHGHSVMAFGYNIAS